MSDWISDITLFGVLALSLALIGWINYFIMRWKWEIVMKLINGMGLRRKDPELDAIFKKLGE